MNGYNDIEARLLNNFQHYFPLVCRPFRNIGTQVGLDETEVIDRFGQLAEDGVISRIGPVFSPGSIGASTLAALAVPAACVEEIAAWLNTFPEINHNYEREHDYNLWFVVAAPDQGRLNAVLNRIANHVGFSMLVLPMVERYHIDLGFDLNGKGRHARCTAGQGARVQLNDEQTAIVAALQSGIRLEREPFSAIGSCVRMDEDAVINQVVLWRMRGVIKRFGVVVRHHELGYRENAMTVWDVPDELVDEIGRIVSQQDGVTLCYRRSRCLPEWPYNLFCMVHGTDRTVVQAQIAQLVGNAGLAAFPSQTLFSRRRFKQCGARYAGVSDGRA
jgi:DNA-binding Lrp family transcriptional regulator